MNQTDSITFYTENLTFFGSKSNAISLLISCSLGSNCVLSRDSLLVLFTVVTPVVSPQLSTLHDPFETEIQIQSEPYRYYRIRKFIQSNISTKMSTNHKLSIRIGKIAHPIKIILISNHITVS